MKIQAIANASELLKIHTSIKNKLNSVEVRDPVTKKTYPIKPFLKMCNYYIPTNAEMNGKGLYKRRWKMNHFFANAQYFIEFAGFPESIRSTRNGVRSETADAQYL
jgi:hypothetical protein